MATPCRLCMQACSSQIDASTPQIRPILHTIFNFWIDFRDQLKFICESCLSTVMRFYEFYKQVQFVQEKFSNFNAKNTSTANNSNLIKSEESDSESGQEILDPKNGVLDIKPELSNVEVDFSDPLEEIVKKENTADGACEYVDNKSQNSPKSKKKRISITADTNNLENVNVNYDLPSEIFKDGKLILTGSSLDKAFDHFYDLRCDMCENQMLFSELCELYEHHKKIHKTKGYVNCCNSKFYTRTALTLHMTHHLQPTAFESDSIKHNDPLELSHQSHHYPDVGSKDDGRSRRKRCKVCWANQKRKDSKYFCPDCKNKPGLCLVPCFRIYHDEILNK